MLKLLSAIEATTRSLSTVELDGRPARRALLSRTYPTSAEDLWQALTDPERIPRWFLPISGDLREGGHFQFEGNAGGVIEHCDAPHRLRVSWGMGEDGPPSWVTLTLTPQGDRTTLELEHLAQVPEELWDRFGPSATGIGWDLALGGLDLHVTTGRAADPAEVAAWLASPDGVEAMLRSGRAWEAVDVADGAAPEDAAARAARTVALYTGQAEPSEP